ncbi:MAG: hypothetical protein WD851_18630 [Pirellulales bacterium]
MSDSDERKALQAEFKSKVDAIAEKGHSRQKATRLAAEQNPELYDALMAAFNPGDDRWAA